jgi:HPt (histidine-containing phosphotransfer) domain-containing protein
MFNENSHLGIEIALLTFIEKGEINLRILQLFSEEQENVAERIRQAFLRKDMQEAKREVHMLGDVLATIGDDSVYPLAKMLEKELGRNSGQESILRLIEQLADEMFELIQVIKEITEERQ